MPGIRCDCQDLVLIAVECISVEAKFLVPEGFVESLEKSGSLCAQALRALGLAHRIEHFSQASGDITESPESFQAMFS